MTDSTLDTTTEPLCAEFSQIPSLEGRTFRGRWFAVDADRISVFEHATYTDTNSTELADENYDDDLIEGFHLLSLLDHLLDDIVRVAGSNWYSVNYGLDRVRFVTPVLAGNKIRAGGTVGSVIEKSGGYLLRLDIVVELEFASRPAFTAQSLVLWLESKGQGNR